MIQGSRAPCGRASTNAGGRRVVAANAPAPFPSPHPRCCSPAGTSGRDRVVASSGAFAGPGAFPGAGLEPGSAAALVAPLQALAWAAVAWVGLPLVKDLLGEDDDETGGPKRACPACEGTGVEPCFACSRWSDGDRGCPSCGGSGLGPCSKCRGGGTAVPVRLDVMSDEERLVREQRRRAGLDDGWGGGGGRHDAAGADAAAAAAHFAPGGRAGRAGSALVASSGAAARRSRAAARRAAAAVVAALPPGPSPAGLARARGPSPAPSGRHRPSTGSPLPPLAAAPLPPRPQAPEPGGGRTVAQGWPAYGVPLASPDGARGGPGPGRVVASAASTAAGPAWGPRLEGFDGGLEGASSGADDAATAGGGDAGGHAPSAAAADPPSLSRPWSPSATSGGAAPRWTDVWGRPTSNAARSLDSWESGDSGMSDRGATGAGPAASRGTIRVELPSLDDVAAASSAYGEAAARRKAGLPLSALLQLRTRARGAAPVGRWSDGSSW